MFPSPLYLTCMCVSDNAHKSHLEKVNNFLESKFYIKFCGKKGKIYTYIEHFFVFVVKFNAIFPKCSDYCGKSYPLSCVMFFCGKFPHIHAGPYFVQVCRKVFDSYSTHPFQRLSELLGSFNGKLFSSRQILI